MGRPADGIRRCARALQCSHGVGGGLTGEEEMGLGIPLIPDRAAVRSTTSRRPFGAFGRRRLLLAGAGILVVVLVAATAGGAVPIAGAIGIALLVPAAVVDVEQRRLPDAWVAAGGIAVLATLVVDSVVGQPNDVDVLGRVALGALMMSVPLLVLHLVSPASMGFGDVKAAIVLGAAIGTADARLAVVALCLAAGTGATVGLATGRRTIAFGPYLVAASLVVLLAHDPILAAVFTRGQAS